MTKHVIMVVDKSGSMMNLADDVIGGFNQFLDDLKESDGYKITTMLFDTTYNMLCVNASLEDAPRLNTKNYNPSGYTALYDAVGRAVDEFTKKNTTLDDDDRVVMVIQTDGLENSSMEYNEASINKMLTGKLESGKWEVIYIGAGRDTWAQAQSMGVARNSYLNTSGSRKSYGNTYSVLGQTVAAAAAGDPDYMKKLREANKDV